MSYVIKKTSYRIINQIMSTTDRNNRIQNEILVDAYDDEEQAMSWFYYMQDNLDLPFKAVVRLSTKQKVVENITVDVVELDPRAEQGKALRFGIVEKGSNRIQYIYPNEIVKVISSEENLEIINDWLFWSNYNLL
jgi:hypothetical protein